MTIVAGRVESEHLRDYVVVIIVHVLVNFLFFLRSVVNNFVSVFFGHDINLVVREISLKFLGMFYTARTERHAGILVKFLSQSSLQWSSMISYLTVTAIIINLGFSHH